MTMPEMVAESSADRPTPTSRSHAFSQWLWTALPLLLILGVALALRLWQLDELPPGLTHDEANHANEAMEILDGVYRYFFPLNYGSEPLYSYTVAGFMAMLGETLFALRLVNVVFGVAAIALTYFWAAPRLGRPTALLAAGLLAVSFWPLASSREALRAGMLPFFMTLAVLAYWRILEVRAPAIWPSGAGPAWRPPTIARVFLLTLGFALAIAATLHIYLAARVSWLLFPLFLLYLALFHQALFRRSWWPVVAGLLLAGMLTIPMAVYLNNNPEMQTRVSMLDGPVGRLLAGEFLPALQTARDALLAFVWPGYGDQFLAYNIPGRPVFDSLSAVFFVAGIVVCLWRWRQPAYLFLLLWLLIGIVPSLITGPTANTTRNLAALPAVYLTAAVGFVAPAAWLLARWPATRWLKPLLGLAAVVWLGWAGWASVRDYFVVWGESVEVRDAYRQTLVSALDYLEAEHGEKEPLVFSTLLPGPAHDSSVARLIAGDRPEVRRDSRWVDARYALVLPEAGEPLLVVPSSTPLHPLFRTLVHTVDTVHLRPDDLDPRFTLYEMDRGQVRALLRSTETVSPAANFNDAITLTHAAWLQPEVRPGETAELLTTWVVDDPGRAGPIVLPSFTTDAVLFTHVLDEAGQVVAQRDTLDAPSWAWRKGDLILQIHPVVVSENLAPGHYNAVTGLYDRASGNRLPLTGVNSGTTTAPLPPLTVSP